MADSTKSQKALEAPKSDADGSAPSQTFNDLPNEVVCKVFTALAKAGNLKSLFALGRTSGLLKSMCESDTNELALAYAKQQTGNTRIILENLYVLPGYEMRGWRWICYGVCRAKGIALCVDQFEVFGGFVEFFKLSHDIPFTVGVVLDDGQTSFLKQQVSTYLLGAELMSLKPTLPPFSETKAMEKRYIGATLSGLNVVMAAFVKRAMFSVDTCKGPDLDWLMEMQLPLGIPHGHVQRMVEGGVAMGSLWLVDMFVRKRPNLTTFSGDIDLEHAMLLDVADEGERVPYVSFAQVWKDSDKADKEDFKAWSALAPFELSWTEAKLEEKARMELMKHIGWSIKLPKGKMEEIAG